MIAAFILKKHSKLTGYENTFSKPYGEFSYRYNFVLTFAEDKTIEDIKKHIEKDHNEYELSFCLSGVPLDVTKLKEYGLIECVHDFRTINVIRNGENVSNNPFYVYNKVFEAGNGYYKILSTNDQFFVLPIEGTVIVEIPIYLNKAIKKIYPE